MDKNATSSGKKILQLKARIVGLDEFPRYFAKMIEPILANRSILIQDEKLWSNNNAESVNAIIRQSLDHKPRKLLQLIDALHICIEKQLFEERSAIHNMGDYELVGANRIYLVTNAK